MKQAQSDTKYAMVLFVTLCFRIRTHNLCYEHIRYRLIMAAYMKTRSGELRLVNVDRRVMSIKCSG